MAAQQRSISVSEFFAKNRHLLGFDNKRKALLTAVKEAVDNSLDACEEAGILPELHVTLEQIGDDRWRVTVRDNGPGIPKSKVPSVFGRLLYGSKFHRLKMSRGQQGIGISAAGMYGLLTTGQPLRVVSRVSGSPACEMRIAIDTNANRPEVVSDEVASVPWEHGTEVGIELEATYTRGRQSVDEYVELTAIANPHAEIHYRPPSGPVAYRRAVSELPGETREIKPHPHGVELGTMMKMLKETSARRVSGFLTSEFCRISDATASGICREAKVGKGLSPRSVRPDAAEALYRALQAAKIKAPPKDCLAPIGAESLLAGMLKGVKAEFYTASVRPPAVYRGNPFQIEVALAWGGNIGRDTDEPQARLIRFANRVPLLYQPGSCCTHRAAADLKWNNYGMSQSKGSLPRAPLVVLVHMASVWVPYTSEGKESIADYDEIRKEIRLALGECGRRLGALLRRKKKRASQQKRRDVFARYIGEVVDALASIKPDVDAAELRGSLTAMAKSHTARADEEYDDHGRVLRAPDLPNTVVVELD